jgi:putative acetyltransferase
MAKAKTGITIRRAQADDATALYRNFEGPGAYSGTLQLPYPSLEFWQKRLAAIPEGQHILVACAASDVVGHLTLNTFPQYPRRRHAADFGMAVRDEWAGKGVGSALLQAAVSLAEDWLQITRIELTVFVDNAAARALYKKFGFVEEGVLRNYAFRDGELVDAVAMARLRPPRA